MMIIVITLTVRKKEKDTEREEKKTCKLLTKAGWTWNNAPKSNSLSARRVMEMASHIDIKYHAHSFNKKQQQQQKKTFVYC